MIPTTDIKYFTDPIVQPDLKAEQVLVCEVRYERHHNMIGRVVNVKGFTVEHTKIWWLTESGNYVYGPSAGSLKVPRYSTVLAKYGDMWACGENIYRSGARDKTRLLTNIRTSTGQRVPHGAYLPVNEWVRAAEWAHGLFPEPEDSDEVIAAKVALAKRKWETRHAKVEIMREGIVREWTADLKRLQDASVMFTGVYGAFCKGTALIPVNADQITLQESSKAVVATVKASEAGKKDATDTVYAGVPVEFFAPLETMDVAAAKNPSAYNLVSYLRQASGSNAVMAGPMEAEPILMSTY